MNYKELYQKARLNLNNTKGWRTKRQIVVFESDDWGSIRMPTKDTFNRMLEAGIRVDKCPYNSFDTLETENDFAALYEVLLSIRDINGQPPVFTANYVTCNPDFLRIKETDFQEYHYESFIKTFQKSDACRNSLLMIKQGIAESIFLPQFHGREHLNVNRWMNALRKRMPETLFGFENKLFGLSTTITSEKRRSYLAAFDFDSKDELCDHGQIIVEGLSIFRKIFGFSSESFIASNYIWHRSIEEVLSDNGIKYIQGTFLQREPQGFGKPYLKIKHYTGFSNQLDQVYLSRNAYFEPSFSMIRNPVKECLNQIKTAFFWNKPAVISTHRLNYIGGLEAKNRESNLVLLKHLLFEIKRNWKNVEFFSSPALGNLIMQSDYDL